MPSRARKENVLVLGLGEYYRPGQQGDVAAVYGREHFLRAVSIVCPEVLDDLRDNIQPRSDPEHLKSLFSKDPARWSELRRRQGRRFKLLCEALRRWAIAHRLIQRRLKGKAEPAEWALDSGVATMLWWARYPARIRRPGFFLPPFEVPSPLVSEECSFVFSSLWQPTLQREADFDREAREGFEASLKAFKARLKDKLEQHGWRRVPKKFARDNRLPDEHFRWLASFQIHRWSPEKIAREYQYPKSVTNVQNAISQTADLIGLALRGHQYRDKS